MEHTGLTTFAAVFMGVSMASVTALMVWCFYRILSEPKASPGGAAGGAGVSGSPESSAGD